MNIVRNLLLVLVLVSVSAFAQSGRNTDIQRSALTLKSLDGDLIVVDVHEGAWLVLSGPVFRANPGLFQELLNKPLVHAKPFIVNAWVGTDLPCLVAMTDRSWYGDTGFLKSQVTEKVVYSSVFDYRVPPTVECK